MYEKYFNLKESPFRITPDPRFLWYSTQHQEAREKIFYHLNTSRGPILMVAPIGTGKTTLARRIKSELDTDTNKKAVMVFSPKLTTNAFLRFVMDEFGVKTERSYGGSLKNFETFLAGQYKAGTSCILLIDEAQNMTTDMLLLIQHLFNFSTDKEFLINIALFSQPELLKKLTKLESLQNRLSVAKVTEFNLEETKQMLEFRWRVAGGEVFPFTPEAVEEIQKLTLGIPRTIVKLANESLLVTAVDKGKMVSRDAVKRAFNEISLSVEQE
jgi:general secretion pathway protein A